MAFNLLTKYSKELILPYFFGFFSSNVLGKQSTLKSKLTLQKYAVEYLEG